MSTAHTFDYTANWLLLPSPKGDAEQRRLSSHDWNRGLSDGFFCKLCEIAGNAPMWQNGEFAMGPLEKKKKPVDAHKGANRLFESN
jgi:hypothetical protein